MLFLLIDNDLQKKKGFSVTYTFRKIITTDQLGRLLDPSSMIKISKDFLKFF